MAAAPPAQKPDDLASRMSVVVGTLDSDFGVVATLLAVVQAAVETVPGALCAQVTLPDGKHTIHAPHSTDHPASHPEGRSIDGELCPAAPATCRLDLSMTARGREVGVLTTWCGHAPELHEQDRHITGILATHAALAVHHARQYETLTAGLDARDVTGQAKGILMHKYGLTAEQAFDLLRRVSMETNHKVRDLALQVIRTGALPHDAQPLDTTALSPVA